MTLAQTSRTHRQLGEALLARLSPARCLMTGGDETPWSSITFSGARHRFDIELQDDSGWIAAKALAGRLPEAEFDLRNDIVADIAVVTLTRQPDRMTRLEIEALTVMAA